MKKLSTIIIAMALLFGMAQCKKQETPASAGKTVHITLNMGNNGSRHTVDPISGAVDYTEGDIIYVGNNGKYIGFLTADANRVFSGGIQDPSTEDYLHFYFLGGKTPATAPTAGTTESFTINIADQSDKLPVLSYAPSTVKYTDGNTMYEAELQNKCALAKFTLTQGTNEVVKVAGMNNEATVNFATSGITATDEYGFITLNSGNETETQSGTVRYAILLPQDEVDGADVIIGETSYTPIVVPAIEASRYYGKEGDLVIDNATPAPAIRLLSEATAADCGMVVCADGHLHDAKTAVPNGCTAVGILGKVTETGHGLILALQNANSQNWNTINGWTSTTSYASTTLKVLPDAARGTNLTSYTTLGETTVSNWAVAQLGDYNAIFTNLGSTTDSEYGKTFDGNVNAYITEGVGGTAISGDYWSATNYGNSLAMRFDGSGGHIGVKSTGRNVRPVLAF